MDLAQSISITGKPELDSRVCTFRVSQQLLESRSVSCTSVESAKGSPLLEKLFEINGVEEVLVSGFSITVLKSKNAPEWKEVGKKVGTGIREAFALAKEQEKPLVKTDFFKKVKSQAAVKESLKSDEAKAVIKVLAERIEPSVAVHGGAVELADLDDHIAFIEFSGGCQGCGAADETLKKGVAVEVMKSVPSIRAVKDLTDHQAGQSPYYRGETPFSES